MKEVLPNKKTFIACGVVVLTIVAYWADLISLEVAQGLVGVEFAAAIAAVRVAILKNK